MPTIIRLNPELPAGEWRDLLEDLPRIVSELPASHLIQGGRNDIYRVGHRDGQVVVKRFVNDGVWKKIAYRFGSGKARRSFENSLALLRAGLHSPTPVGWREDWSGAWLRESYYVCGHVSVAAEARGIRKMRPEDRKPLLELMGRSIAQMHEAGILHLDLTPRNFLFVHEDGPGWELHFVDNNRMSFGEVGLRRGIRSILQCGVKPGDAGPFVDAYASQRGFDPALCLHLYQSLERGHLLKWRVKNATRPWRRKIGL